MDKTQHNILRTCDYCIEHLKIMREKVVETRASEHTTAWNIAGIIFMLTAKVIDASQEAIANGLKKENPDAKEDLEKIRTQFNEFIDRMMNN